MTDPQKLRALADWFDLYDKKEGNEGMQVQADLRRIADNLEKERPGMTQEKAPTWEEIKNQVAKAGGWKDWKDFEAEQSGRKIIQEMYQEAAELYARSKWEQACNEQRMECAAVGWGSQVDRSSILNAPAPEFKP